MPCKIGVAMAPGGHWGLATETRHSCWLDSSHWRRILEQQGKPCTVPGVCHGTPSLAGDKRVTLASSTPVLPPGPALPGD